MAKLKLRILLLLPFIGKAQVYNYDPIRHHNIEANPSTMASGKSNFTANMIHQGSAYKSNSFYYDNFRMSYYNPNYYTGLGITINNTNVNDSCSYRYVGIGAAYRTIIFNRVFVKFGGMYKIISATSPAGYFGYYSFTPLSDRQTKTSTRYNANLSTTFSSSQEKYYISFGILNFQPKATTNENSFFPHYYFVNVGDFAKWLHIDNWELSYTAFTKQYTGITKRSQASHYLTVLHDGFMFTRYSSLRYGTRIGWADDSCIHLNPSLTFYQRKSKRHRYSKNSSKNIFIQLMFDAAYDPEKQKMPFKPTIQLSLTYQL